MLQGKRVDTKAQRDEHDVKFTKNQHKVKKIGKEEKIVGYNGMSRNLAHSGLRPSYLEFRASLGYIQSPKTE